MVSAIKIFIDRIGTSRNRYIKKILRVKNGFNKFRNVNNIKSIKLSDCEYNDIKINVLISNKDGSIQIIGEIQWLLNIMKSVKEKGHSLYSLVRSKEFMDDVNSISNRDENNDNNSDDSSFLEDIISTHDLGKFTEYLFGGNYNIVNEYSIYGAVNRFEELLLHKLLRMGWYKGAKLLLSHMYHLLRTNNNSSVTNSIKKYLNNSGVIFIDMDKQSFFGINLRWLENSKNETSSSISDIIGNYFLNSQYFNEIKDESLIYNCVKYNFFKFASLLLKYRSDDSGILNGINYNKTKDSQTPLFLLLISQHCSKDWINLLLSFENIDINIECNYNGTKCNAKSVVKNEEWLNIIVSFEMKS